MKTLRWMTIILVSLLCWGMGAGTALAVYDLVDSDTSALSYDWDGTTADRFRQETAGSYQFDYGDNATVTFNLLPWSIMMNGNVYTQIVAKADGTVYLGDENGPAIKT